MRQREEGEKKGGREEEDEGKESLREVSGEKVTTGKLLERVEREEEEEEDSGGRVERER